jgi:hypothetical protein
MEQALYEQRLKTFTEALEKGIDLQEPVTFYSTSSPGLACTVSIGTMHSDGAGNKIRMDEKIAEFTPIQTGIKQPDGYIKHYGYLTTADPQVALFFLKRAVDPKKGDVVMSEEYALMITPPEELVRQANARLISSNNELEAMLIEKGRIDEENRLLREQLSALAAKGSNSRKEAAEAK